MALLYTIILYLNIPIALASFFFAYILLRRAKGDAIYFNFGMAVLFLGLWITTVQLMFLNVELSETLRKFFFNVSFIFGLWILHFFTIFTYKYPFPLVQLNKKIALFYLLSILVSVTVFIPNFYTIRVSLFFPYLDVQLGKFGLALFITYFIILSVISFRNLITRYLKTGGIFRIQLKKIILGTAIAILANLLFSLVVYFFVDFDTEPIGGLFTFAVIAYIYSILFSKNIKGYGTY